jgi:hypothetical protein
MRISAIHALARVDAFFVELDLLVSGAAVDHACQSAVAYREGLAPIGCGSFIPEFRGLSGEGGG